MLKQFAALLIAALPLAGCHSDTKESLVARGVRELQTANPRGAMVFFEKALEHDADCIEARLQLAKAYAALGKFPQAEVRLNALLSVPTARDQATLELARLYNATGRGDRAFTLARGFFARHPDSAEALETMSAACVAKQRYRDAELYLQQAMKLAPDRPETMLELASLYLQTGGMDRARQFVSRAVRSAPQDVASLDKLAALEKKCGERGQAVALYRKVLSIAPNDTVAEFQLGQIAIENGELDEAALHAEALIRKSWENGDGQRLMGMVHFYRKNYTDAVESLELSLKVAPNLEAYYFLGLSFYHQGLLESAQNQFRAMLDRSPDSRQARLMVGRILLIQNRLEDAIREIRTVIAANDADAVAHHLLGSAYLAQGNTRKGMGELQRAAEIDPEASNYPLVKPRPDTPKN